MRIFRIFNMATNLEVSYLIEKIAIFKNENWTDVNYTNLCVKLSSDILQLTSPESPTFTLKLTNQMKGCIKDNIILIAYEDQGTLNKIKVKINYGDIENVKNSLDKYFPMQIINSLNTEDCSQVPTQKIQELLSSELERPTNYSSPALLFPPGFLFDEFIKNCITDPKFPDLVDEVEKSIHRLLH